MLGFFDTCIHVALLRGSMTLDDVLERAPVGPIRLSPVVASELLRGARARALEAAETLVARMTPIEPPSWRAAFFEAGRLLPRVFADHESLGLARLQNDVLMALTARHAGALLVTLDAHFEALRGHIAFPLAVLQPPT
jgi:predicted nucleic acid-binding protein